MTPTNQAGRASIAPAPSGEEAAAIVAALEMFVRATARPAAPAQEAPGGWQRAAALEGIERSPWVDVPDPWINT